MTRRLDRVDRPDALPPLGVDEGDRRGVWRQVAAQVFTVGGSETMFVVCSHGCNFAERKLFGKRKYLQFA
jgi:hypothetical protein